MPGPTFLNRVLVKNYRSIGACDLTLGPLTFLVGPNGSGKSNFLDALRFVADSLRDSLDHAIRERGGIGEVRRRSTGHPNNFSMRLDFTLDAGTGHYSFHIGSKPAGGFEVLNEECVISGDRTAFYHVKKGSLDKHGGLVGTPPPPSADRLYLPLASGWPVLRPIFESLSLMGFYNLNPDRIRDLQAPDAAA